MWISEDDIIYGTFGIHPHEAKKHKEIKLKHIIEKVKQSKKIIGIGESGLDFYYNHSEKKDQIFSTQELKIGLSWKSVVSVYGRLKSLTLSDFAPLFKKERQFINLQYGEVDEEINLEKNKNFELYSFDKIDLFKLEVSSLPSSISPNSFCIAFICSFK